MTYTQLASREILAATQAALQERGIDSISVSTKEQALKELVSRIPQGASVMNGASQTLEQIGFVNVLKENKHGWKNMHEEILAEKDQVKQGALRRQATTSDYYLGSVHAVAQSGEMVIASNTGSQLPHLAYSSPNVILVVSTKKIAATLDEAMKRLTTHVVPLEDKRMQAAYGMGTSLSKIFIWNRESVFTGRKILVIFVEEDLGF